MKPFILFAFFALTVVYADEGCGEEETKEVAFTMLQLAAKISCPILTKDECLFIHEAQDECPCICDKRLQGQNPDGVGNNGDGGDSGSGSPSGDQTQGDGGGGQIDSDGGVEGGDASYYGSDGEGGEGGDGDGSDDDGLICFSSQSTVTTDQGILTMHQLLHRPDARVLAWDGKNNEAKLSPIQYWLHAQPDQPAKFRKLDTDGGASLLITDTHVIYRSSSCQLKDVEAVLAAAVSVDDCLMVRREGGMVLDRVQRATEEHKVGIYAPVTVEGTVIVDDVAASCFAMNENTQLQTMLSKYTSFAFDFLGMFMPQSSNAEFVPVSHLYLALNQLQKYFL